MPSGAAPTILERIQDMADFDGPPVEGYPRYNPTSGLFEPNAAVASAARRAYIDWKFGSDTTGAIDRGDFPFLTLAAANAAALAATPTVDQPINLLPRPGSYTYAAGLLGDYVSLAGEGPGVTTLNYTGDLNSGPAFRLGTGSVVRCVKVVGAAGAGVFQALAGAVNFQPAWTGTVSLIDVSWDGDSDAIYFDLGGGGFALDLYRCRLQTKWDLIRIRKGAFVRAFNSELVSLGPTACVDSGALGTRIAAVDSVGVFEMYGGTAAVSGNPTKNTAWNTGTGGGPRIRLFGVRWSGSGTGYKDYDLTNGALELAGSGRIDGAALTGAGTSAVTYTDAESVVAAVNAGATTIPEARITSLTTDLADKASKSTANTFTAANTFAATHAEASGTIVSGISITPTINQPGSSASDTDIFVNRTETALGSGAQYFSRYQAGSVDKHRVTNTGQIFAPGLLDISATPQFQLASSALTMGSAGLIQFSSTASASGSADVAIVRAGAKQLRFSDGSSGGSSLTVGRLYSGSSGVAFPGLTITTDSFQSGTAGATDLLIDHQEDLIGSGSYLLIDAQVNTASKFKVDRTGLVTATTFAGSAASLTSVPAAQVTGANALPDGVLSTNVALLATAQQFTAAQRFGPTAYTIATGSLAQFYDATATTGSTLVTVRAGAGQSSNPIQRWVRASDGSTATNACVAISPTGTQMQIISPFYCTDDNSIQIQAGAVRLGSGSVVGCCSTTAGNGSAADVAWRRQAAGVWQASHDTGTSINQLDARARNFTTSTLPTAGSATKGRGSFATDGRAAGEASGAGGGVMTFDNGAAFVRADGTDPSTPLKKRIYKTADQAVINSATLTNDTALQFSMAVNTKYAIRCVVFYDTTAAGDFKYAVSGPASPTLVRASRFDCVSGGTPAARTIDVATPGSTAEVGTGTTGGYVEFDMIFHNGANAGTFAFQFAQNTATNDTGAIVLTGSYLEYAAM